MYQLTRGTNVFRLCVVKDTSFGSFVVRIVVKIVCCKSRRCFVSMQYRHTLPHRRCRKGKTYLYLVASILPEKLN